MTDTPRKKLTLSRKPKPASPTSADQTEDSQAAAPVRSVRRPAKRRVVRNEAAIRPKPKPVPKAKKPKRPTRKNKKKALVSPSDLKAQAIDKRLQAFAAWSTFKPLAKGVEKTVFKLANDEALAGASKKVIQKLLWKHTHHERYLQAVSRGGMRYQLDGADDVTITDYERQLALESLAKRAGRVLPKR